MDDLFPKKTCPKCGVDAVVPHRGIEAQHNLPGSWREVEPGISMPRKCPMVLDSDGQFTMTGQTTGRDARMTEQIEAHTVRLLEACAEAAHEANRIYCAVKDAEKKERPCMLPYTDLPREQRAKDDLFLAVVAAMASALRSGAA